MMSQNVQYQNFFPLHKAYADHKVDIVFVGDSITYKNPMWNELFENNDIANRGIGSDTTYGLLNRLDTITSLKPKKIFIMIGINDIARDISTDEILVNYEAIIVKLQKDLPKTKVFVQSILPVTDRDNIKNEYIQEINSSLKQLADSNNCTYINLYDFFVDKENNLRQELTIDGVHLSANGYEIWRDLIKDYVDK